jgi:hypothetical protein
MSKCFGNCAFQYVSVYGRFHMLAKSSIVLHCSTAHHVIDDSFCVWITCLALHLLMMKHQTYRGLQCHWIACWCDPAKQTVRTTYGFAPEERLARPWHWRRTMSWSDKAHCARMMYRMPHRRALSRQCASACDAVCYYLWRRRRGRYSFGRLLPMTIIASQMQLNDRYQVVNEQWRNACWSRSVSTPYQLQQLDSFRCVINSDFSRFYCDSSGVARGGGLGIGPGRHRRGTPRAHKKQTIYGALGAPFLIR